MTDRLHRRSLLAGMAALPFLGAAASAQGAGRAVQHGQGSTSIPARPGRVAVFDVAALDILAALEVTEPVVGIANSNAWPAPIATFQDQRFTRLGTLFEPDYERVNAVRPELIVTGGRSSAKYQELAKLAPAIDLFRDTAAPLDTTFRNTDLLAGIFGREAQAEALKQKVTDAAAALRAETARRGRGLIVLTTGTRMSAYGAGSRFGVIHNDFGVPPAVEGLNTAIHGQSVNNEFILQTNPDWLFVVDRDAAIERGADAARKALDNPLVRQTRAWKDGQVVYLEPASWYLTNGGIRTAQMMVEEIAAAYASKG
ncbi:siderophore ABC transporter substrate-binding protein [Pseudoroseomonas globiformis]|uniref:Siderophore ABC transporter substrate-binding protein n=1 Tax=Teichococcus globiformis TaxID=2307229 RepID=A0ABV7G0V5_9PROT